MDLFKHDRQSRKQTHEKDIEAVGGESVSAPTEESAAQETQEAADVTPEGALQEQLAAAQAEAVENRDKHLRAVAELENYRRRTAREFAEMNLRAGERILTALLDPTDNLARALEAAAKAEGGSDGETLRGFIGGVGLIYRQLVELLEKEQVTPMESVGAVFDPNLHDALAAVEREDVPANTVVQEIQRGYRLGDRVLRHAKVVVSKAPVAAEELAEELNEDESQ